MSNQLRYIVSELDKEPFNKQFNLIQFDSLDHLQLLQVLTDVLSEIDPKQRAEVREESADQTAIRIFSMLRVLKYRPPSDASSLAAFRQGIVQGDKHVIHPILEWLFKRMPELKDRAYLARFLVKVDIPSEFMADDKISELYDQYVEFINLFTDVHKQYISLKNSSFNMVDIKKDIASMEDEKDQLIKRVERLKKKVESVPNSAPMLAVARNLRIEMDREEQIVKQKHEQRNLLVQLDQRIQRLHHQIKDAKQAGIGTTSSGLLQSLQEEARVNTYLVKEKMPREIDLKKKSVMELQRVVSEPAMGQSDLDGINQKIRLTNGELNNLVEKRMMSADPTDDKLSLFRQQAAIINRKKEAAAESLSQIRDQLAKLETDVAEKRSKCNATEGEQILKGDEFKKYVNRLRTKNTTYKKKRHDISKLRAESGVLSRTEEILEQKRDGINRKLSNIEAKRGVSGYRDTQDAIENMSAMKSDFDDMKSRTLEDISHMIQQLTKRIVNKKDALAPIIKELRPLRQHSQDLATEYNEKKTVYDSLSAGLESNSSKLEQEVHGYYEEISAEESRYHYMTTMIRILQQQQLTASDEMKSYVSNDPAEKKKSFRELYSRKIQEQENLSKSLRDRQNNLRDNQDDSVKQVRLWRDVERLMQLKLDIAERTNNREKENKVPNHHKSHNSNLAENRLVL